MFSCFKPKPKSINCDNTVVVSVIDLFDDPDVVERDPSGRYIRSNEILGKGKCKIVYKAFDEVDGIEVAWNQVRIDDQKLAHSPEHLVRLYSEVSLLKSLKHENVIKCYCSWVCVDLNQMMTINMITELFTSGDLRQYRRKHKNVDVKAIKNWARQVLRGLDYLHTHNPPIIHRDLQGDNIFINGNTGRVKIGDLGLAVVMRDHPPISDSSFVATPEFMAPELYNGEEYNQLVDIYSFGMCMLEMATCEYPYSECQTEAQVCVEVTSGRKPASVAKVTDPEVRQFIEKCLVVSSMRFSAADLLNDPFLALPSSGATLSVSLSSSSNAGQGELASLPREISQLMEIDIDYKESSNSTEFCESNFVAPNPTTLSVSKSSKTTCFTLLGKEDCSNSISMNLRITGLSGDANNIDFMFDLQKDTSLSIAGEMVDELNLPNEDATVISGLMDELMAQLATNHCEPIIIPMNKDDPHMPLPQHMKDNKDGQESLSVACSGMELCKGSSSGTSDNMSGLSCISYLALDDGYDQCNELKMELVAIDSEYEQRKAELMKMREEAIENAKRKWAAEKATIT